MANIAPIDINDYTIVILDWTPILKALAGVAMFFVSHRVAPFWLSPVSSLPSTSACSLADTSRQYRPFCQGLWEVVRSCFLLLFGDCAGRMAVPMKSLWKTAPAFLKSIGCHKAFKLCMASPVPVDAVNACWDSMEAAPA